MLEKGVGGKVFTASGEYRSDGRRFGVGTHVDGFCAFVTGFRIDTYEDEF